MKVDLKMIQTVTSKLNYSHVFNIYRRCDENLLQINFFCPKHPCSVPNIHVLYQTYMFCTKHSCSDPNIHVLTQTSIFCPKHPCSVPNIHVLSLTSMFCPKHPCSVPNIHALSQTSMFYLTWVPVGIFRRHAYPKWALDSIIHFMW